MARTKEEMAEYNREYRKRKLQEDPDFFKRYKGRDKEAQARHNKEYRERKLQEDPDYFNRYRIENRERINEVGRKSYKKNADRIAAKKQERRAMLNEVKLTYGCCNPDCCWSGDIAPCALDFHHLDPDSKDKCVTFYVTAKMSRMVEEVGKCTVLCAVCHRLERFGVIDANSFERCNVDEECVVISE